MVVERSFVIGDRLGLHARAATAFVQTATRYAAEIEVEKDGQRVSGKSILEMLMLVAACGSAIRICGRGVDAERAVQALGPLVESGFES